MKISVITPSFNSGASIERAIQSVIAQDYGNYEHIVVDGASTDGTVDILKKYGHLKWVSERDRGQVHALNKGFLMSTGDVIVYLNADDHFCEGAFSAVMPHFESGDKMVVGKVLVRSEKPDGIKEWINDARVDFVSMLRHWEPDAFCVNPIGYFYRRELQEEIGGFNEENDARHDLEFLLELALRCDAKKIDKILGVFNHSFDTKTGLSQLKPSSWSIESRPFIDRLAKNLPPLEFKKFQLDRERGYQLRRHWTMKECFERGMAQALIEEGEILLLPEDMPVSSASTGLVEFEGAAAKGDWVIVLLSMDGAAGYSIHQELKKLPVQTLPAHVYYTNTINKARINDSLVSGLPSGNQAAVGLALRDILDKHGNDLKWKFITGVRDPIACQIEARRETSGSGAYETRINVQENLNYQIQYFDAEYKDSFGIDIYQYAFDHEKGYVIIKDNNIEILIYRFEDLPRIYSQAMEEFLGVSGLRLPRLNNVSDNELAQAYNRAKQEWSLVDEVVNETYSSRMVRHFYTRQEIDRFNSRWISTNSPQTDNQKLPLLKTVSTWLHDVIFPIKRAIGRGGSEGRRQEDRSNLFRIATHSERTAAGEDTIAQNACSNVRPESLPAHIAEIPINSYSYAKKSHFNRLKDRYGSVLPQSTEELKYYQDLVVYAFISENVPQGSRLLEIGGGRSRIMDIFKDKYECWNLDKFEGVGNGPKDKPAFSSGYTWVNGYAGEFHKELRDCYFDLVFSISVLEHIPRDKKVSQDVIDDCNRVLRQGGHSIHLLDMVLPGWRHPFIEHSFEVQPMLTELISMSDIKLDPDLYVMSKEEYDRTWLHTTKKTYEEFGPPSSYNLIWRKEK